MLLQAHALTHRFDTTLYEGLDFGIDCASSAAILGVSGSGKSSLLNNLSTLLPPCSGRVEMLGHSDIYALSAKKLLSLRRREIGIIFQSHYLFRGFSARENLQVAALLADGRIDEEILDDFGIAHILEQQIGELSGGQQQRLSIARVLTKRPKIIFADEPTGNLDATTAHRVMDVIFNYVKKSSGALILATHDESIARRCQRVYRLCNGALREVKI